MALSIFHQSSLHFELHWKLRKWCWYDFETFSNAFSWMESFAFLLKFYWSLFLKVLYWLKGSIGFGNVSQLMMAFCHEKTECCHSWDPFYWHGLTLIPAWIRNSIHYIIKHYKVWDEITYPYSNFNGAAIEVWKWISNFILHFIVAVITSPCWD